MKNLNRIWGQSYLSHKTRLRLYMTLVVPILLYAFETWTLTKQDRARVQAFHMRCQRQILGIYWHDKVTNREVTRRTGLTPIGDLIQKRRHSLFGHAVGMSSSAPAHMALRLSSNASMGRRIPTG